MADVSLVETPWDSAQNAYSDTIKSGSGIATTAIAEFDNVLQALDTVWAEVPMDSIINTLYTKLTGEEEALIPRPFNVKLSTLRVCGMIACASLLATIARFKAPHVSTLADGTVVTRDSWEWPSLNALMSDRVGLRYFMTMFPSLGQLQPFNLTNGDVNTGQAGGVGITGPQSYPGGVPEWIARGVLPGGGFIPVIREDKSKKSGYDIDFLGEKEAEELLGLPKGTM